MLTFLLFYDLLHIWLHHFAKKKEFVDLPKTAFFNVL